MMHFTGGLPETACGAGSTMRLTSSVRAALPGLLKELGVKRLLDAPCGDCNWISKVALGVEYVGCDVNEDHVEKARAAGIGEIIHLDVIEDDLPFADLMLCRDFHQHLPINLVFKALDNVRRSGIPWLLATSHTNEVNDDIDEVGGFRPLNLERLPFAFGAPVKQIPDAGRILGLWRL